MPPKRDSQDMEVEDNVEENEPFVDSDKPDQEVSKSPENPPVEDEEEPPAKKSKVAEEALKKIEAAKLLKEKEKQEAEEKVKTASPKRDLKELKGLPS